MADIESWVAEHIMGFKRGCCAGSMGGANVSSDGKSEYWWYCDWCGQKIESGKAGPCPKFPFPRFTLVDLMRKLGDNNMPVMVRFDILRDSRRFTIIGPEGRITDTDDPLKALCRWCFDQFGEKQPEPQGKSDPSFFTNLRDAVQIIKARRDG